MFWKSMKKRMKSSMPHDGSEFVCEFPSEYPPHRKYDRAAQCIDIKSVHDLVVSAVNKGMPNTETNKSPCSNILKRGHVFRDCESAADRVKQNWNFKLVFEMFGCLHDFEFLNTLRQFLWSQFPTVYFSNPINVHLDPLQNVKE